MGAPSVLCLVVFVAVAASALPQGKYTAKYDNVDLEPILRNSRLLNNYFRCLMDQGSCTPEGAELKRNLKDALETGCMKCTDKQREGTEKVMRHLIENRPKEFAALEKKYDPKGVYRARYTAEAKKHGIKV